jgi:hypothetical protein
MASSSAVAAGRSNMNAAAHDGRSRHPSRADDQPAQLDMVRAIAAGAAQTRIGLSPAPAAISSADGSQHTNVRSRCVGAEAPTRR